MKASAMEVICYFQAEFIICREYNTIDQIREVDLILAGNDQSFVVPPDNF